MTFFKNFVIIIIENKEKRGKEKMKEARLIYVEPSFFGVEGYALEILTSDGTWGLDSFYGLKDENWISIALLDRMDYLERIGYKVKKFL